MWGPTPAEEPLTEAFSSTEGTVWGPQCPADIAEETG